VAPILICLRHGACLSRSLPKKHKAKRQLCHFWQPINLTRLSFAMSGVCRARRRADNPVRLDRGPPLIVCTRLRFILLSLLHDVGWESLQIPLFPMKIVKLSSFSSVIHMEEGALALTSHIALVYLPNSFMLCIKFGCDSSPLYFHALQHPLWACFCVLVQ
jgi:hypothetical protein